MGKRIVIKGADFAINAIDSTIIAYSVTYNLINVTSSNNSTTIEAGQGFSFTLTPSVGYVISSASVTHNGNAVTPTSGYTYNLPSVSGNILVECVAMTTAYLTEDDLVGHTKGFVGTDGKWSTSNTYYGDFIAITNAYKGGTIRVTAKSEHWSRVAFVKTLPTTNNSNVNYATGWGVDTDNGAFAQVTEGTSSEFTVPNDANYLFVYIANNAGPVFFPQEIAIEHT